ncbi:sensor histidine kinase [Telluribacter sp. SYSU D00476]|uniref:sensor histidine kinase n=1 Tax=Telluribacter sp. SYSU D00476 TaxID=2811430 RepID=UPI001FF520F3|nr:histidine kinase [Telluribacter sp. SYSU D00476]
MTPQAINTLDDKWLRITGISLLTVIGYFANYYSQQPLTAKLVASFLVFFLSIFLNWHVNRFLILYFRNRYPQKQLLPKRLFLTFLTGSIAFTIIIRLMGSIRFWILFGDFTSYETYHQAARITLNKMTLSLSLFGFDFVMAITNFLFFQAIYETLFFIRESSLKEKKLQQAEQEREKLRAANLQSQLDALKQQVNPHFLFNSLNVLDSLIEDNPQQARVFLEELSTVYRYLLRSNEQYLTNLENELDFINSYYHLLKTRLGNGLQLNVNIGKKYQSYKLPPLTLQLLVENAFKHNIILPDQPLVIDIVTDDEGHLLVQNNVQRKSSRINSNGVGLTNILAKYRMLSQPDPSIREDNGLFVVTLPLIEVSI